MVGMCNRQLATSKHCYTMIIGLLGRKGSGKDEFCRQLGSWVSVSRTAFGDALKQEVAAWCGVSIEYIESHKENFRLIMQGWGTEFRRMLYGYDYWVKQLPMFVDDAVNVVTDVRFQNEADFIRANGGVLVRIDRSINSGDQHVSEHGCELINVDYVISNDGSIKDLSDAAWALLNDLDQRVNWSDPEITEFPPVGDRPDFPPVGDRPDFPNPFFCDCTAESSQQHYDVKTT